MDLHTETLSECSDDELVTRAQQNDEAAFAELLRRTSPSSLRLAMSILRDRQDAEDEVQNSYFNAWRHVSRFQREAKFSTWISRIVANQCLMRLRKVGRSRLVSVEDNGADQIMDQRATPEARLSGDELSGLLRREIAGLPPLLKGVLVLRDVEELSTAEVAARLGISVQAVKSRLLRARSELRNRMQTAAPAPVH